ncbi:hypothetical protein BDW74DRAFT_167930 [Aspergillus multicolor]|uniref:uncharacterized protein n=1 Tax=Aspergillus multicolor TaxID=41759 RepID=UPI003CCD0469
MSSPFFDNTPFSDLVSWVLRKDGPPANATPSSASEECEGKALVDWNGADDPENPQNWSTPRKTFVQFQICLLTVAIYTGSAIITPAEPVFGVGPLFFSPLSEVPRLGRNIPYMTSLLLFLVVTAIASRVSNYPGLVVLRFLQGFLGSPALATGGASISDVLPFHKVPYGSTCWMCASFAAPALGPLLAGFSLLILNGVTFLLLFFCLPETNGETILLRRAQRLRRETGNPHLRSKSEALEHSVPLLRLMAQYLTTPLRVSLHDPSVAFMNLYTAFAYAVYYSYFESFPRLYTGIYGFSTGLTGVVFLSITVASALGAAIYILLVWRVYEPYTLQHGVGAPEHRLVPGLVAAAIGPAGLFLFGWTAREAVPWVVPTLGILVFSTSLFIIFNVIIIYLPTSYPRHAASLFAANSFSRSALASGTIHFSQPLFANLGLGRGCSVLGNVAVACCVGLVALWHFGDRLRARSRFAS